MLDRPTVLIMAGGTGGHIFPALATAEELQKKGCDIHWLGTPNSMEAELVPKHGIEITHIPVTGLRGKGIASLLKAPLKLMVSLYRVMKVIRRMKPVCVLGMGGYVTGPGGLAARLMGVPLIVHEQNAIAGFTNKILSKIASRTLVAFPSAFPEKQFTVTGNPVRNSISCSSLNREPDEPLKLLVVGGSRGAIGINKVVPESLAKLSGKISVWHQTGKGNADEARELYEKCGVKGRVEPFIDDMASAYNWADVVLCRSGALTVSELALAQRASILIPFPFAVDDHQTANGNYLVEQGAALMVQQKNLSEEKLTELLTELYNQPEKLEKMSEAAGKVAHPRAAIEVAEHCLEIANAN
ncbi:undecaprenyldiphospho-muramoylpentapeptide beta-N-acetylglucosaminyltransferase [Endozoicomonas sp. OPT23]|uniref:undecaprenyldiphospho-muramoylpentapeptide beta-N-acetylglucosaminyltransferase n=1 Tax=Endozoicomonas sp. OPT23 TaxID=2072845 RepID=UPI00129B302F|nr:undecaprenyldiphospho-muramoylpentapeptide beta-N-acetylglucosaminyltransferase [Endozoicomonas sp. OPT23]MRI35378.1 undecaprenyldiphospho-muramoylpentapeptide beta-N-acetylglucosaminyltransferase [Endozoicomonas sp. OPT23]